MKSLASGLFLLLFAVAIVSCSLTGPTGATPILNGGYACMNGNDRVHPNCGATPTPPPAGIPTYNGCTVFPANDPTWNTNVSSVTADADNTNMMAALSSAMGSSGLSANHSSTTWAVNQANSGTPLYSYTTPATAYTIEQTVNNVPFLTTYQWEGKGTSSDHHLMIVSNNGCYVVEAFSSFDESSGPSWSPAPTGATPSPHPNPSPLVDVQNRERVIEYNLASPFPTPLVNNSTSKMGSNNGSYIGLFFPGLVRWEDYQNNTPHALELDVPLGYLKGGSSEFVYPSKLGCSTSNCTGSSDLPPMGAHIVLLSTAPGIPSCYRSDLSGTCPQTSFVLNCLMKYGAYFSDLTTGTSGPLLIRMANKSDYTDPWSSTDLANLTWNGSTGLQINSSNFKFIPPPFSSTSIANCLGSLNPNGC